VVDVGQEACQYNQIQTYMRNSQLEIHQEANSADEGLGCRGWDGMGWDGMGWDGAISIRN
jgi:hypothetical protein